MLKVQELSRFMHVHSPQYKRPSFLMVAYGKYISWAIIPTYYQCFSQSKGKQKKKGKADVFLFFQFFCPTFSAFVPIFSIAFILISSLMPKPECQLLLLCFLFVLLPVAMEISSTKPFSYLIQMIFWNKKEYFFSLVAWSQPLPVLVWAYECIIFGKVVLRKLSRKEWPHLANSPKCDPPDTCIQGNLDPSNLVALCNSPSSGLTVTLNYFYP